MIRRGKLNFLALLRKSFGHCQKNISARRARPRFFSTHPAAALGVPLCTVQGLLVRSFEKELYSALLLA